MAENAHERYESYAETILRVLASSPERPALITAEGRTVRAGELCDGVRRAAAELAARGIGRGSTVSLLTGNQPEALLARYATNLLGARVVFLGEGMAPEVQARIVTSVGTAMLLVAPAARSAAEALIARLPIVPDVLTLGPASFGEDLIAHAAARSPETFAGAVRPEDDWCVKFTGGTTGIPKGVQMAHGPYRHMLTQRADRIRADQTGADRSRADARPPRLLVCTPLAHMAGIVADIVLLAGGTVVLQHPFDAGDVLAALGREHITDLWLLPPLLYELLDHPDLPSTDVSALRRVFYGGTSVSARRLREANEAFGPVLHGWYGQTEAGNIAETLPDEHAVTGPGGRPTAGRAAPGADIEIRAADGTVLPPGEAGEIHVRTPMMMSGYWQQPELTAHVLRDGWIRTGDVGCLDADGYLYLLDRLKDIVVVVGGHVYPAELEQLLLTHPAVARCAVFGVSREDGNEEVHAAIVSAEGHEVGSELVREFVREHKGAMYVPRAVHVVDAIPLTDIGKPDKKRLRATVGRTTGRA
ncbi:AMP-binding protein [Streptomyces sp. NPDC053048]|uniref:AMP-binding protein n=1 Tax=Streptomyces sp. NPDC053048 TaxID=3365694 RepID=UPI0037D8E39D